MAERRTVKIEPELRRARGGHAVCCSSVGGTESGATCDEGSVRLIPHRTFPTARID
jgi:hypothetical protein